MAEVSGSRKDHGHAQFIGRNDGFLIAQGAAGLDYETQAAFMGRHYVVIER